MTSKKPVNRIPEADIADYRRWKLPPIDDRGLALPSAERELAEREASERKKQGERVEDVDYQGAIKSGMSARELADIVENAEKEGFEQGRQAGYEKGRAEGYEAGQEQGRIEKRQELTAEQQRFEHLSQSLLDPLADQEEQIEHMLLDMVCQLSRSVVERELMTDSSHILTLVKAAVAALPRGATNLRLYLNPDDLALVETYAEEQQLNWRFLGDDSLLPGGCRVETRESRVDFSVEHRLRQQLEAFVNRQLGGTDESVGLEAEAGLSEPINADRDVDPAGSSDRAPAGPSDWTEEQ